LPDSFLILAPLLVLAVVLLLGFAGCGFEHGLYSKTLTLRARVPTNLTVLAPGVEFGWTRPDETFESMPVMTPVSFPSVEAYINAALNLGPPALLWTLGNVNGLQDRTGKGNDGTALGGVTIGGDADGPTDFVDATATVFDGTNDGIGSSYNPFAGTAPRTFVGWARWDLGGPAEYTLFGSSAGDADRPTLRVVVGNRNVVWLPSGADGQVISWTAAAGPEDTWFMWALLADPGNNRATLYIDGAKISTQPMTDDWPLAPGTFQAAIGATTKQPFKGAQGLVAVYEKALSDAEIAMLHGASQGGENVYEHKVPSPGNGSWSASCTLTVQADGQTSPPTSSPDCSFGLTDDHYSYVFTFQAEGSPSAPPFGVSCVELSWE
jgi:hypothetical protein